MRKLSIFVLLAALATACAIAGDRPDIVMMGNSITAYWPQRGTLFISHPEIACRGISGQTSAQMLRRFRKDVVNLKPQKVVINAGTNDIAENDGPYSEDRTFANIVAMAELARANNIEPLLASVLPAGAFGWRPEITDAMDRIMSLNDRIRAYAQDNNLKYIDYFGALVNADSTAMNQDYAMDTPAVHPNSTGYLLMEQILLDAIND